MTTGTTAARSPAGEVVGDAPPDAVRLIDVSVSVPRRAEPVLREVSLGVAPGEHVLVLGPSGSGKSTLLQVVTGVVPHSVTADLTGDVRLGAAAATTVVERSRHLGVVTQDPGSAVCLPVVEQDLALPLENYGTDPARIGPRIDAALETVGATHLRHRAAATLSGGESQRVALAAALVTQPQVLLLDEPTSMLDPAGIESVRSALVTAAERYRPAVVVVEHRLDEWAGARGVAGLPPRAVALGADGRVIADGPTATVLREHGPSLVAAGCWLPLEAELEALTGVPGGLCAQHHTELLRGWADDAPRPAPPTGAPVLAAHGLTVGRTPRGGVPEPLLRDLDLEVRPGEVVALLGTNGTGKSTTLLTLAGLLPALEGRVEGPAPGMLFQDAEHQFLAHTVADEVGHGLPDAAREQVVAARLDRHRLSHLAGRNPFRLSGGEKRRTGLAAMLAHDRPCLLADEPTLGLDRRDTVATARAVRAEAEQGRAVVLVSHDLRTVASIADRVVLLGAGRVLADGPTGTVLADGDAVRRAGLALPPVVAWLVREVPHAIGHVLRRLDEAIT